MLYLYKLSHYDWWSSLLMNCGIWCNGEKFLLLQFLEFHQEIQQYLTDDGWEVKRYPTLLQRVSGQGAVPRRFQILWNWQLCIHACASASGIHRTVCFTRWFIFNSSRSALRPAKLDRVCFILDTMFLVKNIQWSIDLYAFDWTKFQLHRVHIHI